MKKFFLFSSLQSTAFLKDPSSFPFLNLLRASCYKVDMRISYAMPIIYFAVDKIKPMNLWSKICLGNKEKQSWHDIILLVELCLCTPFSNATLERFFSHLKVVKTEIRSRLSSESLNSVIRIRMKGLSITEFQENYSNDCFDYRYNSRYLGPSTNRKERTTRIGQQLKSSDQTLRLVTMKATIQQPMDLVTKKIDFLHLQGLF